MCKFRNRRFYHVVNRGKNKQKVFFDEEDYGKFGELVGRFGKGRVEVVAYALLPNHYHFLLKQVGVDGVQKFMMILQSTYSCHLGRKVVSRKGRIFEGNFYASLIEGDKHFYNVLDYIVRNPARHKMSNLGLSGVSRK
ncbi:hypothetical protein HOF67_03165 [Candidatus Peregrinibacteria bacterium]|nr:hypothetical protein [Candidatus Peregrinibacteria bacterium]